MAPSQGKVLVVGVNIEAEHPTQIVSRRHFRNSGEGAHFDSDIIGILKHSHEVSQERRHGQVHAHMTLVSR